MRHAAAATLGLTLLLGATLPGAEKTPSRPTGSWERSVDEIKIRFDIKANALTARLSRGDDSIQAESDYGVSKNGYLFGRVAKVTKQGTGDGPDEGALFSFRYEVKGGTMTLSDYQGPGGAEARQLIEGEYKSVKGKSASK